MITNYICFEKLVNCFSFKRSDHVLEARHITELLHTCMHAHIYTKKITFLWFSSALPGKCWGGTSDKTTSI
jgi:hypothetical protein